MDNLAGAPEQFFFLFLLQIIVILLDLRFQVVLAEGCRLNGFPAHDGAETSGANFEYQAIIAVSEGVLVFEGRSVAYVPRVAGTGFNQQQQQLVCSLLVGLN